jgi:ENTS family enterobactin (siderophore) exporter
MKPLRVAQRTREPFFTSFREGLKFSLKSPPVLVVMLVGITVITFGMPFLQLMPVYVKDVLKMGPGALGILVAIPGILTILGGLVAASLGDYRWKGRLLFLAVLSPPAAALIMSQFTLFWTTMVASCIFGLLSSQYMPSTQAAVMKATPDQFRGRVAALISMTNNLGSVGVVMYATAADLLSIRAAYLIFGLIAGGLQILYFCTMRSYRELR